MVLLSDPRQLKTLLTAITRQQKSRHAPKCRNNTTPPQRSHTNQNDGSMILTFAPWLVKACPTCSRSLDLTSAHLRQKSKCTTGSLHATRVPYPDKNNPTTTGLKTKEATEFSKLLNNANAYLKEGVRQKNRPPPRKEKTHDHFISQYRETRKRQFWVWLTYLAICSPIQPFSVLWSKNFHPLLIYLPSLL